VNSRRDREFVEGMRVSRDVLSPMLDEGAPVSVMLQRW
jgi:hypothetical protein